MRWSYLACLPLVISSALVVGSAASEPTAQVPPSFLPHAVASSVQQAWDSNLALAGREVDLEMAASRLAAVRANLGPQVDLLARYTRADGGRTIDLPIGDLLNGAYATLNDYLASQGRPQVFPSVSNQHIPLLRREEQETKVRVTQVLWRPELTRLVRASRFGVEAQAAQVSAYRRELAHLVASAHLQAWAAESAAQIWDQARELCAEAVRVNEVLFANDKVTRDALLRAQAEAAVVDEALLAARRDARSAAMQLNFLLNRPLDTAIEPALGGEMQACIEKTNTIEHPGMGEREELRALDLAVKALRAREEAVGSRLQPTLGLAVEGGIQGEKYRTGGDASFVQGSVVAEVNLWDNKRRRQELVQAKAEVRKLELERQQVDSQLRLAFARAQDDFSTARAGLATALRRAAAAEEVFSIVQRRQREGVANQLAFLDARQELTSARLQAAIAEHRVLIAASALELARGNPLVTTR